jgi:hypothetical protein
MDCDLDRNFGELLKLLPKDSNSKPMRFPTASFADCPKYLETDQLVIAKSAHIYGAGYRTDVVELEASRRTFQKLGLLVLAAVFRPGGGRMHLSLSHRRSVVRNLIIAYDGLTARASGHKTRPECFCFLPSKAERYPWKTWGSRYWPVSDFPTFTLTNMADFIVSEADWAARDTVRGFGNDDASIRLSELLLNIGYSDETEIMLEGEGGNRGIGINSAEAVFRVANDLEAVTEAGLPTTEGESV